MDAERQERVLLTDESELSAEDWQAKVERLQAEVCALLIKNQAMRMGSSTESSGSHLGLSF
jgi:hypothetical protein